MKGSTESRGEVRASVQEEDLVRVHDEEMSLHRLAARSQINHWQLQCDGREENSMALQRRV